MSGTLAAMPAQAPEKLRAMDYRHNVTGHCVFGIQAWMNNRWVNVGCGGGAALWATAAKRDKALTQLLLDGCRGKLTDLLDGPKGDPVEAGGANHSCELWEPDAMVLARSSNTVLR